jgi:hypothetical protein
VARLFPTHPDKVITIEPDPPRHQPSIGPDSMLADATTAIAIAEGCLMERYQIPAEVAASLLTASARAAHLVDEDAARCLVRTWHLPTSPLSPTTQFE